MKAEQRGRGGMTDGERFLQGDGETSPILMGRGEGGWGSKWGETSQEMKHKVFG